MQRFKRGDAAWLFWQDRFGYPQMHHRPVVVTKKVHRLSYFCSFVANDYRRPREQWALDRTGKQRDPRDMLPYSDVQSHEDNHCNAIEHLRELRRQWEDTADHATKASRKAEEAERQRVSDDLNKKLRPILARMFA